MSRAHVLRRHGYIVLFAALTAAVVTAPTRAWADDAAIKKRIAAHLAFGEFGPARALAGSLEAPDARDRSFAEIARTQALVGARRASVSTASGILDDSARGGVLGEIGSMPFGGGARGGAAIADFDSLIELITSTVGGDTWEEPGGGPSTIKEFRGGVYVDASGVLHRMEIAVDDGTLGTLRRDAATAGENRDVFRTTPLRMVSLNRLEKQAQLRAALGLPPDETMANLAGLHKIQYVFVYPETGDIVLAGPAGAWRENAESRTVNVETGRPVLQLDDLVVLLRNAYADEGRFGCSITPRRENLERTQAFVKESTRTPLKSRGQRVAWLRDLREKLGKQDITVDGLDPRTHVARVIVEADYHMKLIGMGLEDGTVDVKSYLASITPGPDGSLPPMDVLRWWFTLNYDAITATDGHDAFAINGVGAQVLSENEMLTARGERVHTGKSDELNHEFARSFTKNFEALAVKYPVYAELQNVFDLALAAALIRSEDLPGHVSWHMTHFGPEQQSNGLVYEVSLGEAPKEVDSIINDREVGRNGIVVGVSGGVSVDTQQLVKHDAIEKDRYGLLPAQRTGSTPKDLPADAWWWD